MRKIIMKKINRIPHVVNRSTVGALNFSVPWRPSPKHPPRACTASPLGPALAVGRNVTCSLSNHIKLMFQMHSHLLSHRRKVWSFCALCSNTVMTVTDSYERLHVPAPVAIIQTFKTLLFLNILDVHFARHDTCVRLVVEVCLWGRDSDTPRHMWPKMYVALDFATPSE